MSSRSTLELSLSKWLGTNLKEAPPEMRLFYIEWNTGSQGKGKNKNTFTSFSLFGIACADAATFDPEDDADLELLSDPQWDAPETFAIAETETQGEELDEVVARVLKYVELRPSLRGRVIAFGEHEGSVQRYPAKSKARAKAAAGTTSPYFELHEKGGSNCIEAYELGEFDETPLTEHQRVRSWPKKGIKLVLQKRPRLLDFLYFYRGWVVCSDRAAKLLQEGTDQIQVFPAPLYVVDKQGEKPVEGYSIVVLYEKLNCLPKEYVLPPSHQGDPPDFDRARGYKVKISETKGRQVFRINCGDFRLLVTEKFRERFEREGITGVQWLRRSSVP
jgi:hypothetical protein